MTPATKPIKLRSLPRPVRHLARLAVRSGWSITLTRGHHSRWRSPDGQVIVCAGSPGDTDTPVILARQLRRAGLILPWQR